MEIFNSVRNDWIEYRGVLPIIEMRLSALKFKAAVSDDRFFHFERLFDYCFSDLDMSSIPGCCEMAKLGSTNGQALLWDGESCDPGRYRFFKFMVRDRFLTLCRGELDFDPLRVFIKQEPHKVDKIQDGRLRLISCVSVVDAMVDRLLFMSLQKKAISTFDRTNIMIGWTPVKGGFRYLGLQYAGKKILLSDRSSWDWTFKHWLACAVRDLIIDLAVDPPSWWVVAVKLRFEALFEKAIFQFEDGTQYVQDFGGVMKSGCFLTIFINSVAQYIVHCLACRRIKGPLFDDPFSLLIHVIGDDIVQEDFPGSDEYLAIIEEMGFKLKVNRSEIVEFAGNFVYKDKYVPAYLHKHLFRLQHLTYDQEIAGSTLQSYLLLYAFKEEMLELIRKIIAIRGLFYYNLSDNSLRELSIG
nr:hypothetical protein [Vespula vulgaris Luteo-like virus 2]